MNKKVVEVKEISKNIKGRKLLVDISFDLYEGDICGFLGPNGAGKTTFIRILTGLVHPTKGSIKILNYSIANEREKALNNVGAIVESPIFFEYMSGRKNLLNLIKLHDTVNKQERKHKVEEVLKLVGLLDQADDKVKAYSLGMKQRLGIAQALLGDPKVIILDEPSNGLDPMGMKFLRELIQKLQRENGITFFISSHLLDDLQIICNRLVMINKGVTKWQGNTSELLAKSVWSLKTSDESRAYELLKDSFHAQLTINDTINITGTEKELEKATKILKENKIHVLNVEKSEQRLENIFIEMMTS
ncbi:ATP-binding cassette domain-containing protein [Priestia megaterium]|nr:ATP-binding cassette domain-containing protein [Priestia megaterium]MDC7783996.1 ATP-binding cassette domain-containing protein [Priestia megaterium]